ncbi:Crp/Fnr family transcriptional regulator [Paraburkholderia tropica]|uniref:Crp/Fnr family transcriptional regulator n=1 Tax=Paraburkholderia tropica TaxID=92647 RepID=UPI002AB08657|nr:Crp/Fnr family transcriptional regulator [Paraburkholderia tropica]
MIRYPDYCEGCDFDRPESRDGSNFLLAALPYSDWKTLARQLELVPLRGAQLLYETGGPTRFAYFPTTAILSLVHLMQDGAATEVASVGREGMVGGAILSGGETLPMHVQVQSPGWAYRIRAAELGFHFARSDGVASVLLQYGQLLFTQIAQVAACYRCHGLSAQLCRWLLLNSDRLQSERLLFTQQVIADALGVRRERVSNTLRMLDKTGLIRQGRRRIDMLDRPGLEAHSCECYAILKRGLDRSLPRTAR